MNHVRTLAQLSPGQEAAIRSLEAPAEHRLRLMELGFCPGCRVTCLQARPWGDPVAYGVCGAVIALRLEDARKITLSEEAVPCPR